MMAAKDEGDVLDTGDIGLLDTSKVDTTGTSPELVSINFATFEQLIAVPGIGYRWQIPFFRSENVDKGKIIKRRL